MRIISGKHKGRKISAPKKLNLRPTTDRAKEALFNILENRYFINEISVLDLFSGSGNISYEFASRGCKEIIAIDKNPSCVEFIQIMSRRLECNITSINSESLRYLDAVSKKFDIIFADPPYNYNHYNKLRKIVKKKNILSTNGLFILEHDNTQKFNGQNIENRKYGNVHFSLFH